MPRREAITSDYGTFWHVPDMSRFVVERQRDGGAVSAIGRIGIIPTKYP